MRSNLDPLKSSSYDYFLPKELIATYPASPRDLAKLLVYFKDEDKIVHSTFNKILDFIPQNYSFIFNNTKVVKARIFGIKQTGGKVELLLNKSLPYSSFSVFIKGKVNIGTKLLFDNNLSCIVEELVADGSRIVKFYKNDKLLEHFELFNMLENIGHMPLPPYIDRDDEINDEINYQSVFAKTSGAVAAPTASLHFTHELFEQIKQKHGTYFVTLHVGAGTFKGVEVEDILNHKMHSEYYEIEDETVKIVESSKKIVAVGTTATRTIEHFYRTNIKSGEADIFLNEFNKPQRVDAIITNFHLPKSTLIMLVASFIGIEKTMEIYDIAVKNGYRFYSFGDGMLII
ncbi:MAG: tRNA preQ1(34) S-adenosylmethionine ribosyltransferase-isomerase QueA [Campylobacterales bacterium]|nr:tRNA preQ1(34) S-adenosylmethionine ribosyltransferase-isomerase QueA [Campylobacterales bacterium]